MALQQAQPDRFGDHVSPSIDLELVVDRRSVSFDRQRGDDQHLSDLFVGQALRQERQDFALALGQGVDPFRPAYGLIVAP